MLLFYRGVGGILAAADGMQPLMSAGLGRVFVNVL